ncbi:MAG: GntR family transcriptional regulator [Acetobacteraceae bacterium]|nr:GntR family transcriptional regulator [Acetobacteraceae bacterium]
MSEVMGQPKSASAEPLDRFSKTNHAYTILRSQILDGVYLPGDWLRMSRIAASLKLSEMPVREALRLLEKDGLVVMHLHRGAQVAALSFERALEITEVRMHLEYWAAFESASYHTQHSLDAAEAALKRMDIAVDDPVVFAIRNREFATAIYAKCPNTFMREHIQHLWDLGWQYSSTSVFNVMRHRIEDSLVENRQILALLRDGQPEALQAVFDARLHKSSAAWKAAIQRSRQSGSKRAD